MNSRLNELTGGRFNVRENSPEDSSKTSVNTKGEEDDDDDEASRTKEDKGRSLEKRSDILESRMKHLEH